MDARRENENKELRRDEAIERRLRHGAGQPAAQDVGVCPDAEFLAAYQAHSLQPQEMTLCEEHFARCARCRQILALAANVEPAPVEREKSLSGAVVAMPKPGSSGESARAHRLGWHIRWLAPALGAAAVLLIWAAVRVPSNGRNSSASQTLIAEGPKTEAQQQLSPAPTDRAANENSPKAPEPEVARRKQPSVQEPGPMTPSAAAPPAKSLAKLKAPEEGKRGALPAPATAEADKQTKADAFATTNAPPAPAKPPAALSAEVQAGAAEAKMSSKVAGARPAARATTEMAPGAARNQAAALALEAPQIVSFTFASPAGQMMWRAGKGGRIERSRDAGRTWSLQASPSKEDWLAGAAPSDTASWLVGRNGAIARTSDGESWMPVASPQEAGTSGTFADWIGVTATSAQAAAITSSTGQRFATQDGGRTWQRQ